MENPQYSQPAKDLLKLAQELADEIGSEYFGASHIFVALLSQGKGFALDALISSGISFSSVYERLYEEALSDTNVPQSENERIAKEIAAAMIFCGCEYVATEHILIGALALKKGLVYEMINSSDIGIENFIKYLMGDIDEIRIIEQKVEEPVPANMPLLMNTSGVLQTYGTDLVEKYLTGRADPVIGREEETDKCIRTLCRRLKSNPILVGEAGVGKTAVAQCIAQRIALGNVPEELQEKRIITLDISGMLSGTKYRGQFEDKVTNLLKEVKDNGNIIVFIDEVHMIVGAGASNSEESGDLSDILKPALARGELSCIGATTKNEYEQFIVSDNALDRRFQRVLIEESSPEDTVKILRGLKDTYERHHNVLIPVAVIRYIVEKCEKIPDRKFPDKAIDLLDDSCTEAKLVNKKRPQKTLKDKIDEAKTLQGLANYCGKKEEENHFYYQQVKAEETIRRATQTTLRRKHVDTVISGMDIKEEKRLGFQ